MLKYDNIQEKKKTSVKLNVASLFKKNIFPYKAAAEYFTSHSYTQSSAVPE